MIPFLVVLVVIVSLALLSESARFHPKYLNVLAVSSFFGIVLGLLTSLFVGAMWQNSRAHYTDVSGPVVTKVVNGEPVASFKDVNGREWSVPTNEVMSRVCTKTQVVTYTAVEPSTWVTFWPGVSNDESNLGPSLCLSAK